MKKELQEQISQWTENPITVELHRLITEQLKEIQAAKGHAYAPFEPGKTQEILANLNGAEDTWEVVLELLEGDWTAVSEEEDGESIGDLSPDGQGAD